MLNGAFIFAADLFRACDLHDAEITFIRFKSYEGMASTGNVKEIMGLTEDITGRHIIIVEDIIDSGVTAHALRKELDKRGPASVKMASSNQGRKAVCLFRDGRLGVGEFDYEKDEQYIRYLAEDVQDFDVSPSIIVALHTDGTVSDSWWWGSDDKVFDWSDVAQVCADGAYICVVKQNGDVFRVTQDGSEQFALEDIGFKDIKHIYTNHCGNRYYGILGLKNDGSVVTELTEYAPQIDLSDWTDVTNIFFPEEDIVYVTGLKQDGSLIISDNVTAEVY